jgi:hypothetical protein
MCIYAQRGGNVFHELYETLSIYSNPISANNRSARSQGIEVSTPVSYSGRFRCCLLTPGGAVSDLVASACWRVAVSRLPALQATHQAEVRRGQSQHRRKQFSYRFWKLADVLNSRKKPDVLLFELVNSTFCEPLLSPMVLFKWNIWCVVSQMRHIRRQDQNTRIIDFYLQTQQPYEVRFSVSVLLHSTVMQLHVFLLDVFSFGRIILQ